MRSKREGKTLGGPHDATQQRRVIRQALAALETAESPGTIVDSPETWPVPLKEACEAWQPDEPSPVAQMLAPHFQEMLKPRRQGWEDI